MTTQRTMLAALLALLVGLALVAGRPDLVVVLLERATEIVVTPEPPPTATPGTAGLEDEAPGGAAAFHPETDAESVLQEP